jgi:hypothetical protein
MPVAFVPPASASNAAFYAIFGIFVAAMLVLVVIILVWAIRHDVAGRAAWRRRQEAAGWAADQSPDFRTNEPGSPRPAPPPDTAP